MQLKPLFLMALVISLVSDPLAAEEVPQVGEIVVQETEEIRALQERKESAVSRTVITRAEMEELAMPEGFRFNRGKWKVREAKR